MTYIELSCCTAKHVTHPVSACRKAFDFHCLCATPIISVLNRIYLLFIFYYTTGELSPVQKPRGAPLAGEKETKKEEWKNIIWMGVPQMIGPQ